MTTAKQPPRDEDDRAPRPGVRPGGARDPEPVLREALPFLLKMARNRGFDAQAQRDIAQDVAVIVVAKIDQHDRSLGTELQWVIGIARNVMRHAKRTERTKRRVIQDEPLGGLEGRPALGLTPEESARAHAALRVINEALTEEQRAVYELTVEGYSARETGQILGLPTTTVEYRLKEARERLAVALRRLGEDEKSVTRVRGGVAPFASLEDLESALRAGRARPAPKAKPAASAFASFTVCILLGLTLVGSLGPGRDRLAGSGERSLSAVETTAATAAPAGAPGAAGGIRAAPAAVAAASAAPAASAMGTGPAAPMTPVERTGPAAPAVPAMGTGPAAPAPGAGAPVDPERMHESALLRRALGVPPERTLALASLHALRSPSHAVEEREVIRVRALAALGRRSEAVAHARRLDGTLYEKQARDTLAAAGPSGAADRPAPGESP